MFSKYFVVLSESDDNTSPFGTVYDRTITHPQLPLTSKPNFRGLAKPPSRALRQPTATLRCNRAATYARCRANVAHISQSKPDSGFGPQVKGRLTFQVDPSSLGSGCSYQKFQTPRVDLRWGALGDGMNSFAQKTDPDVNYPDSHHC